jgi:glycosyltransferase involved in cell wall biosynthesis
VKLLHVTASYLPAVRYGGLIVSVHALCRALAERGHDVEVFTTSVDGAADSPVAHEKPIDIDGVRVWYFRSTSLRRFYYAPAMAASARSRMREFDVVHTHAMFLWPGWALSRVALREHVPYVVSPRGMLEKSLIEQRSTLAKAALIGFVERPVLQRAAAIHVTSAREADELMRFGFDLPPIHDIPNGTDARAISVAAASVPPQIRDAAEGSPFALFLGRISWKKGLDRLIAALPHAPGVRVVAAGNDDESYTPKLLALAAAHDVADRIQFIGPVYGDAKSWLLSRASFLILPSYSENFGNVVLEGLAHGRPVLMTPEVGVADIVYESGAGVVADGTPVSFGRALADLAGNDAARQEMGRRGLALIDEQFGWAAVAARMENVYEAACDRISR